MDRDGRAELTIVESSGKLSPLNNLRVSTTRTLSKLRETHADNHNKTTNSKHSWGAKKFWSRVHSFADRPNSLHPTDYPLDIELLLRLYACNSNMEKSIQRVIERAEERNSSSAQRSLESLSDNFPSIELGAAYRLIYSLKESCCKNPSSPSPSYCEILLALRKLAVDCNDKRLKSLLLNDPTLTMCERCGVISCAGPLDLVHQQCQSNGKPDFLKGAGCSRIINAEDLFRAYRKIKSSRSEREQGEKVFQTQTVSGEKRKIMKEKEIRSFAYERAPCNHSNTLVPEKEVSTKPHKIIEIHISEETPSSDSNVQSNQINNPHSTLINPTNLQSTYNITRQMSINNSKATTANYPRDCHIKQSEKLGTSSGTRCEKKRAQSDFKSELLNTADTIGTIKKESNKAITWDNIRGTIDRGRYLARGPFTAAAAKERAVVSQRGDATSGSKSRRMVRGGFVLHGSRDDIPQIDADGPLHQRADTLRQGERKLAYRYTERSKSESLTWSLENDSLENCAALPEVRAVAGESESTGLSSSSAENLMREWLSRLAPTENEPRDREGSITPDASSNILGEIAARISGWEAGADVASRGRQSKIDAPSLKRCTSKIRLADGRSFSSKNDATLIPPIAERDEAEEAKGATDTNPQDYKVFPGLRRKSPAGDIPEGKQIENRIPEADVSVGGNREAIAIEMLSFYRKMFEDTRKMDWESFQVLVERVHPRQKEVWREICRAIGNEVRRAAEEEGVDTEVCIEITPTGYKEVQKETRTSGNEIVFGMDITFADIETFLDKGLTSSSRLELDTYPKGIGRY